MVLWINHNTVNRLHDFYRLTDTTEATTDLNIIILKFVKSSKTKANLYNKFFSHRL